MRYVCGMKRRIWHGDIKLMAERLVRFQVRWATGHGHWADQVVELTSVHSEGDTLKVINPETRNRFTIVIDTIVEFAGGECVP